MDPKLNVLVCRRLVQVQKFGRVMLNSGACKAIHNLGYFWFLVIKFAIIENASVRIFLRMFPSSSNRVV